MAVSHVKSITVADFTGTVTAFNSQGSTTTIGATDLVRPSDWNSAHNQFYTLTGNTNNASTASGANVVLSGGNNITLIGSNSVIGISAADAPAVATLSGWNPFSPGVEYLLGQMGQNTLFLMPMDFPAAVKVNNMRLPVHFTAATNSTGSATVTQNFALYTSVNSTQISRLTSWSVSTNVSHNGTQNSASNVGGVRTWSGTHDALTITAGAYVVAFMSSTASANANVTLSQFIASNMNTAFSGGLNQAANASGVFAPFQGSYSVTSAGFPDTIGTVDMRGSAAANMRWPLFTFGAT